METKNALAALAALSQESRLAVFRFLVQVGPEGVPASRLSDELNIPPSSLSFHLKELLNANLVTARPVSRFIFYAAQFDTMNALLGFLTENCCGGNPCVPACTPACSTEGDLS